MDDLFSIGDLIIVDYVPGMIVKVDEWFVFVQYPSPHLKNKVYKNRKTDDCVSHKWTGIGEQCWKMDQLLFIRKENIQKYVRHVKVKKDEK